MSASLSQRPISIVVLATLLFGQTALAADRRAELTITLRCYNYAHIGGFVLTEAKKRVSSIFERIGVKTIWVDSPGFKAKDVSLQPGSPELARDLTILITGKSGERVALTKTVWV